MTATIMPFAFVLGGANMEERRFQNSCSKVITRVVRMLEGVVFAVAHSAPNLTSHPTPLCVPVSVERRQKALLSALRIVLLTVVL